MAVLNPLGRESSFIYSSLVWARSPSIRPMDTELIPMEKGMLQSVDAGRLLGLLPVEASIEASALTNRSS